MSSNAGGPAISAPDAGESRVYRQHLRAGRRPILVCVYLMLVWMIVGAWVFGWLFLPATGRLGWSLLGLETWLGPPVLLLIPPMAGPRGPFRDWWWPRLVVRIDDRGVTWWTEDGVRRPDDAVAWSAVATVGPTFSTRDRPPGADCALTAPDDRVLARLPCRLARIDRPVSRVNRWRRVAWLPDVAVAVRPDRYRRRRLLGRRATLRDPAT
jgi:hypothetical protein